MPRACLVVFLGHLRGVSAAAGLREVTGVVSSARAFLWGAYRRGLFFLAWVRPKSSAEVTWLSFKGM